VALKGNEFDRQMQQLEAEIKKLEAEYNMFFAGRLPRLPWETRKRIEERKLYDAVAPFVETNPVSLGSEPPAGKA